MDIDMSMPEDRTVKARVLQKTEEVIGFWNARGRVDGSGKHAVHLYAAVHWIEHFGILHMKFSVGGEDTHVAPRRNFPVVAPDKTVRIQRVDNISDAGRLAVDWLVDVRQMVFFGHKELTDTDAFELDKMWAARIPPRPRQE